ncbi:hypothetical protein ACWGE0_35385 [Lentzea sp. NPDC054927]
MTDLSGAVTRDAVLDAVLTAKADAKDAGLMDAVQFFMLDKRLGTWGRCEAHA